jgi:hypothetical protein
MLASFDSSLPFVAQDDKLRLLTTFVAQDDKKNSTSLRAAGDDKHISCLFVYYQIHVGFILNLPIDGAAGTESKNPRA